MSHSKQKEKTHKQGPNTGPLCWAKTYIIGKVILCGVARQVAGEQQTWTG